MSTRLCYELYDLIISFLHDDNQTLRTCSLVCRAWLSASQSHLFHHLTLDTPCRRILAVVLTSPHIAHYIKRLSIHEYNPIARPPIYRSVSMEISFPPFLNKLSFLKELEFTISPYQSSDPKFTWSAIACHDIKHAFCSVPLESLAFRHFSFNTIVDIIEILLACQHLRKLHLDNVDILESSQLPSTFLDSILSLESLSKFPAISKKPSIERLRLKSTKATSFISILLHFQSPIDLSNLHHLDINISPDSYFDFAELLRCVPRLGFLEMDIDPSFDYDAHLRQNSLIDLSYIPSLMSLNLHVSLLLGRFDPIPWMVAFLSTIKCQNALQDMSLTFVLDKPPPTLTIQSFDNALAEWRILDHLLTQSPFTGLQRVRLDFALDNPIGDLALQEISDEFISQLQGLCRKGVLEVDVWELR